MTQVPISFRLVTGSFLSSVVAGRDVTDLVRIAEHVSDVRMEAISKGETKRSAQNLQRGRTRIQMSWGTNTGAMITIGLQDSQNRPVATFEGKLVRLHVALPDAVVASLTGKKLSQVIDLDSYAEAGFGCEQRLDGSVVLVRRLKEKMIELTVRRKPGPWEAINLLRNENGRPRLHGVPKIKRTRRTRT